MLFLDLNLVSAFTNYQISKSINNKIASNFYNIKNSVLFVIRTITPRFMLVILDYPGYIYQYDENWNNLRYYHVGRPEFMITLITFLVLK